MKAELRVGASWGHLRVIEEGSGKYVKEYGGGFRESWDDKYYMAVCGCGKEIRIWDCEWKGKRHLRDCGCGLSELDGVTVLMTVTAPARLRKEIKGYQNKQGLESFSRALRDLVELGLAYHKLIGGGDEKITK